MNEKKVFEHSPVLPFDPNVNIYDCGTWGYAMPMEFSGWRDEVMSWKETCYLHAGLNPTQTYLLKGPEALQLLSDVSVNSVARFEVGSAKHMIMCADSGNVVAHGMCRRLGDEEFMTYWLAPYLPYVVDSGRYDVTGEDLTDTVFLFQVAGPRSLEVLESMTGCDLHDIRFMRHRMTGIANPEVEIAATELGVMRIGMAGTLAYEIHGPIEHSQAVYAAILRAGEPFGIRRLGELAYYLNHPENGFPQSFDHFPYAWAESPDLSVYLSGGWGGDQSADGAGLRGSMGPELSDRYCNPFDLGWGHMVKFDHDFIGRRSLEAEAERPRRKMVTLVWNVEDILDVYASQFQQGEEYPLMELPNEPMYKYPSMGLFNDRVVVGDQFVGMSMGRMYSYYYRAMISICPIATEHSAEGTEVAVIWGDPGTRQKRIRATVSRYPYLDLPRNEQIDVNSIPHGNG